MDFSGAAPAALLGPGDAPAFTIENSVGPGAILLSCDHASRAVPAVLGRLGLPEAVLSRHIGWDIGAAAATRRLARAFDAPAIFTGYSRLVIDCNRDPDDPTSIPEVSDGIAIPGNRDLSAAARAQRIDALFRPYHAALAGLLAGFAGRGVVPAFLSIHSFTPAMRDGAPRPWHIGVLWDRDPRIARPLIDALRRDPALVVGDNEPYSAREPAGYTVRSHAEAAGLPHVGIELRQDLVESEAGAAEWAERLAATLRPILAHPALARIEHY